VDVRDPELKSLSLDIQQTDSHFSIAGIELRKGRCKNKECKYSKDEDSSDLLTIVKALADQRLEDAEFKLQTLPPYLKKEFEYHFFQGFLHFLKSNFKNGMESLNTSKIVLQRKIIRSKIKTGIYYSFWIDYIFILNQLHANNFVNATHSIEHISNDIKKEQIELKPNTASDKNAKLVLLSLFEFSINVLNGLVRLRTNKIESAKKDFLEAKTYFANARLIGNLGSQEVLTNSLSILPAASWWSSYFRVAVLFVLSQIIQKQFSQLLEAILNLLEPDLQKRELEWFEQAISQYLPFQTNPLRCEFWYWPIKFKLNELFFRFYASQNQIDEAFNYIESKGLDFAAFVTHGSGKQEERYPIIPSDEYPEPFKITLDDNFFRVIDGDWMEFGGEELWETTLKFYLPCQFYWKFINNKKIERQYSFQLRQRIISLASDYRSYLDGISHAVAGFIFPSFIGKVFEDSELYDEALYYYENSSLSKEEKLKARDRCVFLRDGIRWEPLRKQLRDLSEDEQMQLVAYAKIFRLEIRLRKIVSALIEKRHGNRHWWKCYVSEAIHKKCTERFEEWSSYQGVPTQATQENLVDFPTLSELKSIILEESNWEKVFKDHFKNKKIFGSILNLLEPIRNDIAHARLLSRNKFEDLERHIQKLSVQTQEIEKAISGDSKPAQKPEGK
jgi:hypothetical protein